MNPLDRVIHEQSPAIMLQPITSDFMNRTLPSAFHWNSFGNLAGIGNVIGSLQDG